MTMALRLLFPETIFKRGFFKPKHLRQTLTKNSKNTVFIIVSF